MFRTIIIALAAAFLIAGPTAAAAAAAAAADPFDSARYYIKTKQTADALALIDSGQFDINMQTDEGYSLLHYAAETGDLAMVRALLARGADPTLKSNLGMTPYDSAYATMIKAELRKAVAGRSAAAAAPPAPGTAVGAAQTGGEGMCARAVSDPASASRSPAMRPFLAARDAIWYNHPDELAGLVEDCLKVTDTDEYGWTLLHHAADRDRVALARILVEHGAQSGARNKDGQSAAQLATSVEMKALLGTDNSPTAPASASDRRKLECRQKYEADAALSSDTTGRMAAMRRWQKCLDTGLYW